MERQKPQHEIPIDGGIPMNEGLEVRLKEYWDPLVDTLIANLERDKKRDEEFKAYMARTHDIRNL